MIRWAVIGLCLVAVVVIGGVWGRRGWVVVQQTANDRDTFPTNSTWLGTFHFRPPINDYEGSVRLEVVRHNNHVTGIYATENEAYAWTLDGSIDNQRRVDWRLTEVVREQDPRPAMLQARITGHLVDEQLELVIKIPEEVGSTTMNVADLTLRRVGE